MEIKEYVVILNQGIDYNQVWADIENPTTGLPHIPDRSVNITNSLNAFERLCIYALTDEEAEKLRQDPRVQAVEIPIEKMPGVEIGPFATQNPSTLTPPGNFNKTTNSASTSINWGLIRHSNNSNVYGSGTTTSLNYNYGLDGSGVDVVISDSGIQADHPEFTDTNGVSRVQQINWATYVPNLSTMGNPYQDTNGHGTHVAGITAGKNYGWAKNSRIYSILAYGTGAPSVLDQFSAIKLWHTSKNGSRPTVVNMSWGSVLSWWYLGNLPSNTPSSAIDPITKKDYLSVAMDNFVSKISGGSYRGNNYTGNANLTNKGLLVDTTTCRGSLLNGVLNYTEQLSAALGELISAGIVVVYAAGNSSYKIDKPDSEGGSGDYNNYVDSAKGKIYYHRGSSIQNPGAICAGNMDSVVNDIKTDQKSTSSCAGPRIDIYAAGTSVMSAVSNFNTTSPSYFLNTDYKQGIKSGTSMASPQIAGMCALYLQKYPSATPAEVKAWLKNNATKNLYSSGVDDYTNFRSLLGGSVNVAYQNIKEATTAYSYAKDSTGTWRQAQAVWVKHSDGTWKKATAGWIKTGSGWQKTYQV
jgi:subtilisin family serine protease